MQNAKLIQLLKSFSPKEMKDFNDFICSPYYNRNKTVVSFYKLLSKYYPAFTSSELEKEKLYAQIFAREKYVDSRMRLLTSDLLKLAKKYLTIINLERNPITEKLHLLDEFNRRNVLTLSGILVEELKKEFETSLTTDEDYFSHAINLERQFFIYQFKSLNGDWQKTLKVFDPMHVLELVKHHFLYYVTQIHTGAISHRNNYNYKFNENAFEEIYALFEKEIKQVPILKLYYLIMKICQTKEDAYFLEAEKIALDRNQLKDLPEFLKRELFIILLNYCGIKIDFEGRTDYNENKFKLMKRRIEEKLIFHVELGTIDNSLFTGIVMHAVIVRQPIWATNFVKEYSKYLKPDIRESIINFSRAYICFFERKFSAALAHLSKMDFFTIDLKIYHKSLLARVYYEKNEMGALRSLLDTYRHFLNNTSEMNGQRKIVYTNFLRTMVKLQQVKLSATSKKVLALKNEIVENKMLNSRIWFLEKVEELNANVKK